MTKLFRFSLASLLTFTTLATSINVADARVTVITAGSSNGSDLVDSKGPTRSRRTIQVTQSGGSIRRVRARSRFSRTQIRHGDEVIASPTAGDELPTHVDATSFFAGTATFRSNDGGPVDNFTIDITASGRLACTLDDPDIGQGNALAQADVIVSTDGVTRFSGSAVQDGTGTFTETGDLTGFRRAANRAVIRKRFPINLGALNDGQKIAFFFLGSALVSFGPEVAVRNCSSDFLRTSTFRESRAGRAQGRIRIERGDNLVLGFIDNDPTVVDGTEILFIESDNSELINDIDPDTVKLVSQNLQDGQLDLIPGTPGDVNNNGIPDVVLTVNNDNFIVPSLVANSFVNALFVFGQTNAGNVFSGVLNTTN